jgi:hypothetical protein
MAQKGRKHVKSARNKRVRLAVIYSVYVIQCAGMEKYHEASSVALP